MSREDVSAILKACARFLSKRLDPIEKRLAAVETKEMPVPVIELDGVVKEILTTDELSTLVDLHVCEAVAKHFEANPIRQPEDGKPGERGEKGESGRDGVDVKDLFRAEGGRLMAVLSDGTTKDLGVYVGKDGENGRDGMSVTDLVREYDAASHEIVERWSQAGESRQLRYPAGGIHHGGYWMEGVKALASQSWTHNGTLWIAKCDTSDEPTTDSKDWTIGARKGRDGRDGKIIKVAQEPVKLGGGDGN